MPMVLLPVSKLVYVCDVVIADPVSHKPSILNLWEIVRIPNGTGFPYTLDKLCVVALMRDGQGEIRFRADLVRADTMEVIRRSKNYVVPFMDRRRSTLVVIRLREVIFPQEGSYLVEFFCEGAFVDDQLISVLSS